MDNLLETIPLNPTGVFDRKERRFFVSQNQTLDCKLCLTDDESRRIPGEIVNVSSTGFQVKTSSALGEGQQFVLSLSIPDYSNDIFVDGAVKWEVLTSDGHHYLGCRFNDKLDGRILTHLASLGMLERRADSRIQSEIDAFAQQQLAHPNEIQIVEYSKGGLSFSSDFAIELDSRVKITFPDSDDQVIVTPEWQFHRQGAYRIGCSFNNNHNFEVIGKRTAQRDVRSFLSKTQTNWIGLGIFTIIVWCLFKLCGF